MNNNILIIDDSSSMRQMIKFTLTEFGFNVHIAENGKEGLKKLNEMDRCALVITDIHMPIMNGLDFIKSTRLESTHKYVPIIVLTTESDKILRDKAVQLGATAWIVKPFTPEKLYDVIKKIIRTE